MQILIAAQAFWIAIVCLMGVWWGVLLARQSSKIAELEVASGVASSDAHSHWLRTQRMLHWESSAFFLLALISTGFLFWLYWRDMKRSRSIEAFFASVTHELRTPLTSIRLQAESVADGFSTDSPERPLIERLLEDTVRLEGQVERTLELARVEGGGPVFLQTLQLKPWLGRLVQTWKDVYKDRVELSVECEDLAVNADPTALQVILKNLLENSIRHSKKDRVRVQLRVFANGRHAMLSFQDDGGGYPGDVRDLGKLFHRGSSSQGSGVGLYLVQVLMKRMGGQVRFQNQEGFRAELELREQVQNG